jgi:hypothetical protein
MITNAAIEGIEILNSWLIRSPANPYVSKANGNKFDTNTTVAIPILGKLVGNNSPYFVYRKYTRPTTKRVRREEDILSTTAEFILL